MPFLALHPRANMPASGYARMSREQEWSTPQSDGASVHGRKILCKRPIELENLITTSLAAKRVFRCSSSEALAALGCVKDLPIEPIDVLVLGSQAQRGGAAIEEGQGGKAALERLNVSTLTRVLLAPCAWPSSPNSTLTRYLLKRASYSLQSARLCSLLQKHGSIAAFGPRI